MFSFLTPYKLYAYAALAIFVLGLFGTIYVLRADNKALRSDKEALVAQKDELKLVATQKQAALQQCSDGTSALIAAEKSKTEAALAAVEIAKKEAAASRAEAEDFMFKKPVAPVVTKDNIQNFGGSDREIQLKDYLSTQELANQAIDLRGAK